MLFSTGCHLPVQGADTDSAGPTARATAVLAEQGGRRVSGQAVAITSEYFGSVSSQYQTSFLAVPSRCVPGAAGQGEQRLGSQAPLTPPCKGRPATTGAQGLQLQEVADFLYLKCFPK